MNWGKGILLGMGAFMAFITVMGICMFRNAPDDIDPQYYEKGLAFDSVYNQEKQVLTDRVQPRIRMDQRKLLVNFIRPANGNVTFERLADPSLDKVIGFESDIDNKLSIPLDKFRKGRWDLSFAWRHDNKKYLYHQQINIP